MPLFSHSIRERWPSQWLINSQNFVEHGFPHPCELASFKEILTNKNANKWKQKIDEKYKSLLQNNIWMWMKLHSNQNLVGCKRVYKINKTIYGPRQSSCEWYKRINDCLDHVGLKIMKLIPIFT